MKSIGFGLERIALLSVVRPWAAAGLLAVVLAIAGYGLSKLTFDEDLRNVFGGATTEFAAYAEATRQFVDPENELIILVEGASLTEPESLSRLRDLQFELLFVDGIADVFSMFSLREPPAENGDAPLIVGDALTELAAEDIARVRAHPLLGAKLLSADADTMIYVVTPEEAAAPLASSRAIQSEIEAIAAQTLADTGAIVSMTGFPAIRISVVDLLIHDHRVLNAVGAAIGFAMSFIIFGSLVAALMIAVPAILSALVVAGGLGAFGVPITVMSNVVPVLVMILGYANSMHLCRAWRIRRDTGASLADSSRHSIGTVGPACVLASLTTSVAFLALIFSDVQVVSDFAWVGAIGCMTGVIVVLLLHGLMAVTIGRYWTSRGTRATTVIERLGAPSAALGRFAADHARPICFVVFALVIVFGWLYAAIEPEYSVRENLSTDSQANAALTQIDEQLGGANPIHIIVPLGEGAQTGPQAIEKVGKVHRAVASLDGVDAPLSVWSLFEWLGDEDDRPMQERLDLVLEDLAPTIRPRFFGSDGDALVSVNIREMPTTATRDMIDRIENAAHAAGGREVFVTGVTVVTARESTRVIANLNGNLLGAIVSGLLVILIAFRDWRIALTSVIPNILPLLGTGALIYFFGRGMQFAGVMALTIAFGIAVDGTIHYFNYFFRSGVDSGSLRDTLVDTTRRIGPQLIGTTAILVIGLATTQTSEMPTVALFGMLAAATLLIGLIGDLIVLPALMAGAARRWFIRYQKVQPAARGVA